MSVHYPYFNYILKELELGNESLAKSFGHHVHWGYWENPEEATCDDEDFYLAAENLTRKLVELAKISDNQTVLDAGCGFGGTIALLNKCHTKMKLTGINIDNRQIVRARENVKSSNNNEITFIEGDACDLPFPNNAFDRVLAVECIFHFSSREKFFSEACRVLKPGGSITLSDFVSSTLLYPSCKTLQFPLFDKLNFFGPCNIITLNQYKKLAAKFGLVMKQHDITKHTIPTYQYLQSLLKKSNLGLFYNLQGRPGLLFMKLISMYNFLTYPILSFIKPAAISADPVRSEFP